MRGKEVFYAYSIGGDVVPMFFLDDYRFDAIAKPNYGKQQIDGFWARKPTPSKVPGTERQGHYCQVTHAIIEP